MSIHTQATLIEKIRETVAQEIRAKNYEQIKLMQLEFLKSFKRQQEIMDQTCPNVFTLTPKDQNQAGDSELRLLRQILKKADPSEKWGGLERVLTPEGHII